MARRGVSPVKLLAKLWAACESVPHPRLGRDLCLPLHHCPIPGEAPCRVPRPGSLLPLSSQAGQTCPVSARISPLCGSCLNRLLRPAHLVPRTSLHTFTSPSFNERQQEQSPDPATPKPGRFSDKEIVVRNLRGEECGRVTLPGAVFDVPLRKDIVHSVVRWQLAKRRSGNHSTLAVGEVRGTSRKPWKQKGTGRARQGSLRGPHFRGGATMHGPKPRSHEHSLQKKVRRLGLRIALSARLAEGKLAVYQSLEPETHKTKDMAQLLAEEFPGSRKLLFVDQLSREQALMGLESAELTPQSDGEQGAAASGAESAADSEPVPAGEISTPDPTADRTPQAEDSGATVVSGPPSSPAAVPAPQFRPLTREEIQAVKRGKKLEQLPGQKVSGKLLRATNNLHYVNVLPTLGLNVYSILQHDTLVMSLAAVHGTIKRLHPNFLSRREKKLMGHSAARGALTVRTSGGTAP